MRDWAGKLPVPCARLWGAGRSHVTTLVAVHAVMRVTPEASGGMQARRCPGSVSLPGVEAWGTWSGRSRMGWPAGCRRGCPAGIRSYDRPTRWDRRFAARRPGSPRAFRTQLVLTRPEGDRIAKRYEHMPNFPAQDCPPGPAHAVARLRERNQPGRGYLDVAAGRRMRRGPCRRPSGGDRANAGNPAGEYERKRADGDVQQGRVPDSHRECQAGRSLLVSVRHPAAACWQSWIRATAYYGI